jgi:predicted transcriptional regulator
MATTPERSVKTLAIRLDEQLHAQLSVVAQLADLTITDAIRQAIAAWVESRRSQTDLANKAAGALEEIEREASARREAIQALFGQAETSEATAGSRRSGRKPAGDGEGSD